MPTKWTLIPGNLPVRAAKLEGFYAYKEHWWSGCGQDDYESMSVIPTVSWEGEIPDQKVTKVSKWISYINSHFTRYNPCRHLKVAVDVETDNWLIVEADRLVEGGDGDEQCDYPEWYQDHTFRRLKISGIASLYSEAFGDGTLLMEDPYLPINTQGFRDKILVLDRMALDTMIPQLDQGWSAPRALFEMLELKSLMLGLKEFLLRCPVQVSRLFDRPLSQISGHFLAGIFGWLPFVSDIKAFAQRFENVADDVDKFLEQAGKRQTLHFQKALSPLTFKPDSWFNDSYTLGISPEDEGWEGLADADILFASFNADLTRSIKNLSYHGTLEFSYSIPDYPPGLTRFLAEMDYWGVNLSISDVWQIIPFSFVVDWVWNVSSLLENWDLTNLPVSVVIYDYCRSIKYQLVEEMRISSIGSIHLDIPGWTTFVPSEWTLTPSLGSAQRRVDSYHRWPGIPVPTAEQLPNWRTPRGMQWVIATALVGSRSRKH